jgi:RNA polymerase sigma factor (sigma-70 family)
MASCSGGRFWWLPYPERLSAAYLALARAPDSKRLSMVMLDDIRTDALRELRWLSRRTDAPVPSQGTPGPLEGLLEAELLRELREGTQGLNPQQREVVESLLQGEPQHRIAARLGVSQGRVTQIKHSAVVALRRWFAAR